MLYIINSGCSINLGTATRNFVPILLDIGHQDMMGHLCIRLGNRARTPKERRTICFYCFFLRCMGFLSYVINSFTFFCALGSCILNIYFLLNFFQHHHLKDSWVFLKSIFSMVFRKDPILITSCLLEFSLSCYCLPNVECDFVGLYLYGMGTCRNTDLQFR